ncbi:MAG TPA: hypothetical protein VHH36_01585, partial [Candidatus Thermoplasmatota archaeon]|nr:hypothetical protein [Candidatus Thermoplasmatota archaeon]
REGLVGLVEEGGAYLRRLRALWLGLLPALVFGAAFGAGAIAGRLEELAGPSDAWSAPVTAVLVVLVAALAAAWALSAFTVHRALARWREGMAQRPLGL